MTTALIFNVALSTIVFITIVGMLARSIGAQSSDTVVRTARRPRRARARSAALGTAVLPEA